MNNKVKIGLAIVLLLLATVFGIRAFRSNKSVADSASFVCVKTGETFNLKMTDVLAIPAQNPKTKEWTLLPCERRADGRLFVRPMYGVNLRSDLKDLNKVVDTGTFEVRSSRGQ